MSILKLVQRWNDCKVRSFLKREAGFTGLNYEERRQVINQLAIESENGDKEVSETDLIDKRHFYTCTIPVIKPNVWYRANR